MSEDNLYKLFPNKRIKPYDGMSVTADAWQQAHEYHRLVNQAHNLFFHGSGILIGMEVLASDPPDQLVYILPGVAVDSSGHVIVLSDPVAYDIGDEIEGPLYLTIMYREKSPATKKNSDGSQITFNQDEFLITAKQTPPESSMVELARFNRETRSSAIIDASNLNSPGINQIDQRFRRNIQIHRELFLTAAVIYLGDVKHAVQGSGLANLAHSLYRNEHIKLVVDDAKQIDPSILRYSFLYLVGNGKFQLNKTQIKGLQAYISHGGFLLMEGCDQVSMDSFKKMMDEIELPLNTKLTSPHSILEQSNYFVIPPVGFELEGEIILAENGLLSSFNYGQLWAGEAKDHTPSREELRSAFELGENLMVYIGRKIKS